MTGLLAAVAFSATLIALLGLGDPKRRRSAGLGDGAQRASTRRLLAAGAALPGIAYALAGEAASLLIWFGACAVVGWIITFWLPGARGSDGSR